MACLGRWLNWFAPSSWWTRGRIDANMEDRMKEAKIDKNGWVDWELEQKGADTLYKHTHKAYGLNPVTKQQQQRATSKEEEEKNVDVIIYSRGLQLREGWLWRASYFPTPAAPAAHVWSSRDKTVRHGLCEIVACTFVSKTSPLEAATRPY